MRAIDDDTLDTICVDRIIDQDSQIIVESHVFCHIRAGDDRWHFGFSVLVQVHTQCQFALNIDLCDAFALGSSWSIVNIDCVARLEATPAHPHTAHKST
jgi:hypothetical protein